MFQHVFLLQRSLSLSLSAAGEVERGEAASVAPPVVGSGHGERQRHGGEGGHLPVEGTREEELVEDHHGDRLAEDHADGHNLRREGRLEPSRDGGGGGKAKDSLMLKGGGCACSNLFPLVLVEDDRGEEEDGVTEEPQEAALRGKQIASVSASPVAKGVGVRGRGWGSQLTLAKQR